MNAGRLWSHCSRRTSEMVEKAIEGGKRFITIKQRHRSGGRWFISMAWFRTTSTSCRTR